MREKTPFFKVRVSGNSMLPLLKEGDIVGARLCGSSDIGSGDIAVIKESSGTCICHRFYAKLSSPKGARLMTKGDGRFRFDPPTSENRLIGKVVSIDIGRRSVSVDNFVSRALGIVTGLFSPLFIRPFNRWKR